MVRFKVGGMTCEGCAGAVKRALGALSSSAQVEVDLASGEVRVGAPIRPQEAAAAIAGAGFTVEGWTD